MLPTGALKILRIEIDGHFRGSPDVPRPWVALITGVDRKYGLARTFVDRLNDYRTARRANSGNTYGVVAAFPLREGNLYEVSRLRGSSSKRHVAREFVLVESGRLAQMEPFEALARAEHYDGPVLEYRVPDDTEVSLVRGLGTPEILGFVLVDDLRHYRLRVGAIHEVTAGTERRLVIAGVARTHRVSQAEALAHLAESAAA